MEENGLFDSTLKAWYYRLVIHYRVVNRESEDIQAPISHRAGKNGAGSLL